MPIKKNVALVSLLSTLFIQTVVAHVDSHCDATAPRILVSALPACQNQPFYSAYWQSVPHENYGVIICYWGDTAALRERCRALVSDNTFSFVKEGNWLRSYRNAQGVASSVCLAPGQPEACALPLHHG